MSGQTLKTNIQNNHGKGRLECEEIHVPSQPPHHEMQVRSLKVPGEKPSKTTLSARAIRHSEECKEVKIKRVWSGLYKAHSEKQQAAGWGKSGIVSQQQSVGGQATGPDL